MDQNYKIDYKELKKKNLEQLRSGKPLFGKEVVFAPLLKGILEADLDREMEGHFDDEEFYEGNRKNGEMRRKLKTAGGTINLEAPGDCTSNFKPQIINKRETILTEVLERKITGMCGLGMSFRNISGHIKEMYYTDISATTLSEIVDQVVPLVNEWQNRLLESLYCVVWLDAMYYNVKRKDGL